METVDYLIVGGGYAGDSAAVQLRRGAGQSRVMLVSAERERPYFRYMLSKEFLQSKRTRDRIYLHPERFYEDRGIEFKLGVRAVSLDTETHTVTLDTGDVVSFHKLLLATGATPKRLPIPGTHLPNVYYLRTLEDAEALQGEASAGQRAVIIGGGFIGAELAASFAQLGLQVTIVDIGRELSCDFVVIGTGVAPETPLAESGGLQVNDGIITNEFLETSEPDIFAAGDNTRFYNPLFDVQMRVEHWDVAMAQGQTAARNMLGQQRRFEEVPYFFSHLGDRWMEWVGYAPEWDAMRMRRLGPDSFDAFYSRGPYVTGVLLVNDTRSLMGARLLTAGRWEIGDPSVLEDPDLDLNTFAQQRQRSR